MILIVDLLCKWCYVKNYIFLKLPFYCVILVNTFLCTHIVNMYSIYQKIMCTEYTKIMCQYHHNQCFIYTFCFQKIHFLHVIVETLFRWMAILVAQLSRRLNLMCSPLWFTKFLSSFTIVNYNLHTLVCVQCSFGIFP